MSFQIASLPRSDFEYLFRLNARELASENAVRMSADKKPGFPCRVSLADAEVGEEVFLVHYEHQQADSPFKSSHAVFVRFNAPQADLPANEIPLMLRSRILSLRCFDETGMMVLADLCEGTALEVAVESIFTNATVSYIHVHFAKPGCFAARIDRASK